MNRSPQHNPSTWRRQVSNLGLLVGLSLVGAPPAMRLYGTWWEDRQTSLFLAQAAEAPALEAPAPEAPPAIRKAQVTARVKTPARPARAKAARQPASVRPNNRVGQARGSLAWRDSLLQIPSIGVEAVVTRAGGNWKWVKGPAFDPKSPAPGGPGNAVIAAHRNMWASTFAHLPRVRPGDWIAIQSKGKRHIYVVEWSRKARTSETGLLAHTKEPSVTLYTCLVPFRANERWVVRGRLVKTQAAAPSAGRFARSR